MKAFGLRMDINCELFNQRMIQTSGLFHLKSDFSVSVPSVFILGPF